MANLATLMQGLVFARIHAVILEDYLINQIRGRGRTDTFYSTRMKG